MSPPYAVAQPGLWTGRALEWRWSNGGRAVEWEPVGSGRSPSPGTLSNGLNNVTAISPKDVWAVGSSAGGTLSRALGWDFLECFPSANAYGLRQCLEWCSWDIAKDVWAVGYTAGVFGQGLIQHWDGSRWSVVPGSSASIGTLNGVANSPTDAWAVGNGIQHWDGARWKAVPGATLAPILCTFFGVAAVAANDVWAVGGSRHRDVATQRLRLSSIGMAKLVSDSQHARRDPRRSLRREQQRRVGGRQRIWNASRHALGWQEWSDVKTLPTGARI